MMIFNNSEVLEVLVRGRTGGRRDNKETAFYPARGDLREIVSGFDISPISTAGLTVIYQAVQMESVFLC
jgi:hypothetical protein